MLSRCRLKSIYGSAEAGAVTGAADGIQTPGTVGSVNPGVEVKFTEEGEIVVRGPGAFRGYYSDPAMTARVLDDGWVHTGDKGNMSADQELVFVDRLVEPHRPALWRRHRSPGDRKPLEAQSLHQRRLGPGRTGL